MKKRNWIGSLHRSVERRPSGAKDRNRNESGNEGGDKSGNKSSSKGQHGIEMTAAVMAALLLSGVIGSFPAMAADFGWKEEEGVKYWYEDGIRQGTEGRGREIYDPDSDAWYWLDAIDGGRMAVSKDVYQESGAGEWAENQETGTGKWVRYDGEGHMVKGWDSNEEGTYYFDPTYGTMAKGTVTIEGKEYTFDTDTGILQSGSPSAVWFGWASEGGNDYWYENGVKQGTEGRGREIYDPESDAWYWLDAVDGGRKAVSKDVYQESDAGEWAENRETGTGKWVRYDENGHMVKGWSADERGRYYFDPVYGTMAKGRVLIDGVYYVFDGITGILEQNENPCRLPESSEFYQYEHAYRTGDLSGLSESDLPFYEGVRAYMDYALGFDTPYLQEKAIHDYMLLNCAYDYDNFLNDTLPWVSYWEEGVIVNKTAVCNGYAYAFKLFMDMLGIECELVGSGELGHIWNRVCLDGDWYMVDVTWDDPVPDEPGRITYTYFNMPSWLFGHEAGDYFETAEGVKWLGDATYYINMEAMDSHDTGEARSVEGAVKMAEDRIQEILREESKYLKKGRMAAIYITGGEAAVSDLKESFKWYEKEYGSAFSWTEVQGGNSMLLRVACKYDNYQDYEKECIGDKVYRFASEEAESGMTAAFRQNIRELDSETCLAFYVTGSDLTFDGCQQMVNNVYGKCFACGAFGYRISDFGDKFLIQFWSGYDSYETFLREKGINEEGSAAGAVVSNGEYIVRQGQNISKDQKYAYLISRDGDGAWENGDVNGAAEDIVDKVRHYHPYSDLHGVYSQVYEDAVVIRVNSYYDSYQEYLENSSTICLALMGEDAAFDAIRDALREHALNEQGEKWCTFYVKMNHEWEKEEASRFCLKLCYEKYGNVYSVYESGRYEGNGGKWLRISAYLWNERDVREEQINTSYDAAEKDSYALMERVLAAEDAMSHEVHRFWIVRDGNGVWDEKSMNAFFTQSSKVIDSSKYAVYYVQCEEVLGLLVKPRR